MFYGEKYFLCGLAGKYFDNKAKLIETSLHVLGTEIFELFYIKSQNSITKHR